MEILFYSSLVRESFNMVRWEPTFWLIKSTKHCPRNLVDLLIFTVSSYVAFSRLNWSSKFQRIIKLLVTYLRRKEKVNNAVGDCFLFFIDSSTWHDKTSDFKVHEKHHVFFSLQKPHDTVSSWLQTRKSGAVNWQSRSSSGRSMSLTVDARRAVDVIE